MIVFGTGLQEPIDFTATASRLEVVLDSLSKSCNLKITCSAKLMNDVVAVRAKGVQPRVLMEKIAIAVGGAWEQKGKDFLLIRTPLQERAEVEAQRESDKKLWAVRIAEVRSMLKKDEPIGQDGVQAFLTEIHRFNRDFAASGDINPVVVTRRRAGIMKRIPTRRLALEVAAGITPDEILDFELGSTVYSNSPTPAELQLTPNMLRVIHKAIATQRELNDAISASPQASSEIERRLNLADLVVDLEDSRQIVCVDNSLDVIAIRVLIIRNGKVVASDRIDFARPNATIAIDNVKSDSRRIALGSWNKELGAILGSRSTRLSLQLLDRLTKPEKWDPMSLGTGAGCSGYFEAKSANAVAWFPDLMGASIFASESIESMIRGSQAVAAWERQYKGLLEWSVEDGWSILRPRRPVDARAGRIDRRSLGTLFRKMTQSWPSLDDAAEFVSAQPLIFGSGYAFSAGALILGADHWDLPSESLMLRFFGSLSLAQRSTLWNGDSLRGSMLSSDQRNLLHFLVFRSNRSVSIVRDHPAEGWSNEGIVPELIFAPVSAAVISATRRSVPGVLAIDRETKRRLKLDLVELVALGRVSTREQTTREETTGEETTGQGIGRFEGFSPILLTKGEFKIDFPGNGSVSIPYEDVFAPPSPQYVPLQELPAEWFDGTSANWSNGMAWA